MKSQPTSLLAMNWLRKHLSLAHLATILAVFLSHGGIAAAQGDGPVQLRQFINQQSGGLEKLMVPIDDSAIPQPRLADGSPDPRFRTTEAKRYLGKQLYFDPIRTARIMPEFGGVPATKQTGSCGTCHLGEAAGKSGTRLNFGVGGEGRGYTDASGKFVARRRVRPEIPRIRPNPLFEGDAMADELPTLTDVYETAIGSPSRGRKQPPPGQLLRTGRLDALDSVGRNVPTMVGFAYNNRLLWGGFAGEPDSSPGGLNPFGFAAGESLTQLTLDAHRMQDFQAAELQKIPVYRKVFRDAFPDEAAAADGANGDLDVLINDQTVLRAMATFLRTVVTRNTPWDRFLAGDDSALTLRQRRGARLFFSSTNNGGAGCYTCHSGPMLNKQPSDPGITGAGQFVEENFFNIGIGDHPVQALNSAARKDPRFRDDGRREITFRDEDAFKFRVPALRQLRDGKFFFHNGSFTRVRDVVQYFNAGIAQDTDAGAAATFSTRFSYPRGTGSPRGLGLSEGEVDDLTDFLENALYDRALVHFDPKSPTRTFEPNVEDLIYSTYHPELAGLGAIDGRMASGLPRSNNDALSRRDMGLEFLDVTSQVDIVRNGSGRNGRRQQDVYRLTNIGSTMIDTHLLIVVRGLSDQIELQNASGKTSDGDPYIRVFLPDGGLVPNQSLIPALFFRRRPGAPPVNYSVTLLSGQGNP